MARQVLDLEEWDLVLAKMHRYHANIQQEVGIIVQTIRKEMKSALVPLAEEKANFGKVCYDFNLHTTYFLSARSMRALIHLAFFFFFGDIFTKLSGYYFLLLLWISNPKEHKTFHVPWIDWSPNYDGTGLQILTLLALRDQRLLYNWTELEYVSQNVWKCIWPNVRKIQLRTLNANVRSNAIPSTLFPIFRALVLKNNTKTFRVLQRLYIREDQEQNNKFLTSSTAWKFDYLNVKLPLGAEKMLNCYY